MVDPTAFVSQSSVIGVYGEGFDQIKIKAKKEMKKQEKKLAEAMKKPANEKK
jgi:putative membrane protein